jgi:hypothetical protein
MSGVLSSPHAVLDFNRSLRGNRLKDTRIYYRYRHDYEAFVSKKSSLAVHLEPCPSCRGHERSQYPNGYWD